MTELKMDRNLALEVVRVTEAAALSAARLMGRGDGGGGENLRRTHGSLACRANRPDAIVRRRRAAKRSSGARPLAQQKPINWRNALTIVSVAILVGTEVVGMTWAAGWALGGMFQMPGVVSAFVEMAGALLGFVLLYYFVRAALKVEPIRG